MLSWPRGHSTNDKSYLLILKHLTVLVNYLSISWLFIIQKIQKCIFVLKYSSDLRLFKIKHKRVRISCKSHILFSIPYSLKTMLAIEYVAFLLFTTLAQIKKKNTLNKKWKYGTHCCSVTQVCLTLCDPMDCSMSGFPVLHYLAEFAQTLVHWVNDAIQSSHPLSPLSLPYLNLSQHQGLFKLISSSYWNLIFNICSSNEYSGVNSPRIDLFDLLAVQGTLNSSPTPQFNSINSSALSFLHSPTLTSIYDERKNT